MNYTVASICFPLVLPTTPILESVQKFHLELDTNAGILMYFTMRNAYCVGSASPFGVIYFFEDSLTPEDIPSHLDACGAETVYHISGCGLYLGRALS